MRIFNARITAELSGTERMVVGITGTIETIEDYADLLRKAYRLSVRDVKINTEFVGSVKNEY